MVWAVEHKSTSMHVTKWKYQFRSVSWHTSIWIGIVPHHAKPVEDEEQDRCYDGIAGYEIFNIESHQHD